MIDEMIVLTYVLAGVGVLALLFVLWLLYTAATGMWTIH